MNPSIRIDRDQPMEMSDGTILRANIYRPNDNGKYPAILIRSPYNKNLTARGDWFNPVDAAHAGYAVIYQDTRGRFASEGDYIPGMPEGGDGRDSVEFIAQEPWCTGAVGMLGGSYLGRIQWETAMAQPPSLKAIAPCICTAGLLNEARMFGVVSWEQSISWLAAMLVNVADKMAEKGIDTGPMKARVDNMRHNTDALCRHLPIKENPLFKLPAVAQMMNLDKMDEAYQQAKSFDDLLWNHAAVQVPCFHSGGWYDINIWSLFTNFNMMRQRGGTAAAKKGQHVLCGPWGHGGALNAFLGARHFGPVANGTAAGASQMHINYFDKYLQGKDIDIPAVTYFTMGLDRWRTAEAWPPPEARPTRFYLHSSGRAAQDLEDGSLKPDAPSSQQPDAYVYDPLDPTPTLGGKTLPTGRLTQGPLDNRWLETRADVATYTTAPLTEDIEVTGPVTLTLHAASSAVDTDFTAKLLDVFPDGAAYNVADGVMRARYRHSLLAPEPITPHEPFEITVDLANTSNLFRKGHRIRLDVASANFPLYDRNMNTGNPFGQDAEGLKANQTIFHDADRPSFLTLPVIKKQ